MMSAKTASDLPQVSNATTQLATQSQWAAERALLATVQAATTSTLANGHPQARTMLADMSVGLSKPVAAAAPKIFRLNVTLGPDVVVKLLVVVLRAFVDSLKVADKPDAADLIDLADDLARTYTHDSLKDIILALKEARLSGTKFYDRVDTTKLAGLIVSYFERKAEWLESENQNQKHATTSANALAVKQETGSVATAMLENFSLRIPEGHPASEQLRRKLSITNGRVQRGLISPQDAERQRDEVRRVLGNGRRDYSQSAA
jgi:hypothetical protein